MNRSEKRFLERQNKKENKAALTERDKNIIWFRSWTPSQLKFHKQLVKEIAEDSNKIIEQIMDSCYISAMVQETDLKLVQCINICKLADKHMEETKNFIEEKGEEYFMKINNEGLRKQIREEAKAMILQGGIMSTGVQQLRKSHNVPNKDLTIIWAEAKQELKEIPNYTTGESKATLSNEDEHGFEVPYTVTEKEIEEGQKKTLEVDKSGFKLQAPSTLKIIEQTIKVQGQYETYIKDLQGVSVGEKNFKDIKDLEEYKSEVNADYNKDKEDLEQQIEDLKEELIDLAKRANKNLLVIEEIGQVFNL